MALMTTFGVGLFGTQSPQVQCELTTLAESLGYTNAWFGDSQLIWREAYVTMGATAQTTARIRIGTGVTNAVTRHLSVLASAWVTLAELTRGRAVLGIGAGDSSLQTVGIASPMRLADLEQQIVHLRRLFAGDEVQIPTGPIRLTFTSHYPIPIYIAGSGPKILELAGRVADGVIMLVGTHPTFIEAGLAHVRRGAHAAGRRLEDITVVLWTPTSIQADAAAARDLVRAHVARVVIRKLPAELDAAAMTSIRRIRETYDYYHHMDVEAQHATLVPDELIEHFALAGTVDEVGEQLRRVVATGINQVAIIPYVAAGGDRSQVLRDFADLMPHG